MNIVVKDIKITLRTDSGETFVVEKSCDAPEGDQGPPATRAADATPAQARKADAPAKSRPAPDKDAPKPKRASAAADKTPAKKVEKPEKTTAKSGAAKPRSLAWKPHTEFGYHGYAATDGRGTYKVLKSKSQKWGLLYDQVGVDSVPLGCFQELEMARKAAQAQHDRGMPDQRKVPNFCPVEAPADEPTPEPAQAAPTAQAATPPAMTAEQRAEMMSSMQGAIRAALENVA